MKNQTCIPIAFALAATLGALAQVPGIITYQGRLSVGGTNVFDGSGQFKFALVSAGTNVSRQATATGTVSGGFLTLVTVTDGGTGYLETPDVTVADVTGSNAVAVATISGGTVASIAVVNPGRNYSTSPTVTVAPPAPSYVFGSFWSNDGTSSAGSEPASAVPLHVNQGAFTVNLGDTAVSNMTAAIPAAVFLNPDVRLRIWFNDGTTGFQQFYPDHRLMSVPYAMVAETVPTGAITAASLANGSVGSSALAEGAVTGSKLGEAAVGSGNIAPGAVAGNAIPTGAIGSSHLTDGAVTPAKLANGAVQRVHLASAAVGAAEIEPGAVGANQIADGSISSEKLNFTPLTGWVPNGITAFTNSGTWVKPAGVTRVYVKLWGGGGGSGIWSVAGGGGGYSEGMVDVTGDVSVVVGAGGRQGEDGGETEFLSLKAQGGGVGDILVARGGSASGGALNLKGEDTRGSTGGGSIFGGIGGRPDAGGHWPGGGSGAGSTGRGADGFVIVYH